MRIYASFKDSSETNIYFNNKIPANAFINVKEIKFNEYFNQPIEEGSFPECEKVFFSKFNKPIPSSAFKKVKEIKFSDIFVDSNFSGELRWRYEEELDEKWIHFL